jgi:GxxExxY protein
MPLKSFDPISNAVIGSAHRVLYELKPGLDEKLYERALAIELRQQGFNVESQRKFPVYYEGHHIGTLIPDMIVEDVIVDPKVVSAFNESHLAQMLGYLNITGLEISLLLNFKNAKLGIKRVMRFGDNS